MSATRLEVQQTQKLSQSLQTVISLLSLDLDDLSGEMQKAVEENPALRFVPPQKSAQDYALMVKSRYRGSHSDEDALAEIPAADEPLLADLEQQLHLSGLEENVLRPALAILHMLTPRGYFAQALDEFAAEAGVTPDIARQALEAVQALEPMGIGARSVGEYLEMQLHTRSQVDPLCYDLINLYLLDIVKGNTRQIAKETGATQVRIRQCMDTIRSLSPAPCSLREETVHYIMPEFSVEADADNVLSIQFHNDYYPTLQQDATFSRLAETLQGDELAFARRMQTSATRLIRAVEMRQTTMEKVARIIVREQSAFFLGQYSLLPLPISRVAEEVGVHETTIYRTLQNKYLYCARGTYALSHFFQKEVSAGTSTVHVKEIIQEICRENGRMSDRSITEVLEKRGITLSRRTVAKYRAQMEIDTSFRRKAEP